MCGDKDVATVSFRLIKNQRRRKGAHTWQAGVLGGGGN